MLADASFPALAAAPPTVSRQRHGVGYRSTAWTAEALGRLAAELEAGATAVAEIPPGRRLEVWAATVAELEDRSAPARKELDAAMPAFCGLSPEGLAAALEAVLGGVRRGPAGELFREARELPAGGGLVVAVLASNVPGLAVQPLLPALALGRPVLVKSSTAEPLFAPALVAALCRREPGLRPVLAAVTWPGGVREVETPVVAAAARVVAYGGAEAMRDLAARAGGKLVAYGPKISIAAVAAEADVDKVAAGLARDVALFDQRGCLSIQAVFTAGDGVALARALAKALGVLAERWPPGATDLQVAAGVRQIRAEAEMRQLFVADLPLRSGTVVVDDEPALRPSPGLRTVRIHPLAELAQLPAILGSWHGRLQGAALAGRAAWALRPALEGLGVSRCAPPGELQSPDATWHNGGISPLGSLVESPPVIPGPRR